MLGFGIRDALKREVNRALGRASGDPAVDAVPTAATPGPAEPAKATTTAPVHEPPPEPEHEPTPNADFTLEAVEEVLDEMVRPSLQADGGDISLVGIVGNDIHVRLVGACSTCPSSIMTMKMGVDRLLHEEFPTMGQLIQVDGP